MFFDSDRYAIKAAVMTLSKMDARGMRFVRIKDTLHLSEIEISEALLDEARASDRIEILSDPYEFPFDENGDLL